MSSDILPYPTHLTDGVVELRVHRDSDAPALVQAVRESVDTVGRWQDWCHAAYDLDDARRWMDTCRKDWLLGAGYEMLIVEAGGGRLLGGMGVNQRHREQRFANLGYWVRESAQRQGIATRAGRLAIGFAFDMVKVERLEIVAAHDNLPSRRTAERLGGTFEGMLRKRLVIKDKSVDAAMYSVTRDDL